MHKGTIFILAAGLAAVATPALAQDRLGYARISAGDWAGAERALLTERQRDPTAPEAMINLAAVYHFTGRAAEARALYRAVLAQPDLLLDRPDGATVSSHALAAAQLARLGTGVASR
jgi:Flp pilus assembly protein TadD